MKKLVTISLFIFWTIAVAILTAGLVFYQNHQNNNCLPSGQLSNSNGTAGTGTNAPIVLDAKTVAKHNQISDCWLIISNKIYNVTNYLGAHPGGVGTIAPYCGQEATQAFATKDIGRSHSSYAQQLLGNYYIGDLNQSVNQQQAQTNVNNTNTITPSPGGRGEGFDD